MQQIDEFLLPQQLWDTDNSPIARIRRRAQANNDVPFISDPISWQNNLDMVGSNPNRGATAQFFETVSVLLDGRKVFICADKESDTERIVLELTEDVGMELSAANDPGREGFVAFRFVDMHQLVPR